MTKKDLQLHTIKKDSAFEVQLGDYLSSLNWSTVLNQPQKAYEQFITGSYGQYKKLLKPYVANLGNEITHLTIIPDGELAHTPWDLFLQDAPNNREEISYKNLNYLFKDYSISYGHSASLLFQGFHSEKVDLDNKIMAFAPSYSDTTEQNPYASMTREFRDVLVPLNWTQSEIERIGNHFEGMYLSGVSATEQVFKEQAGKHKILHLAMHALVDNENSMHSKLVFAPDNDSIEDGMLHTYELYNMDLAAELTVLSACNTGIGKVQRGEGVMSLGRAFSYAGCPSVVMSHWSVDDESTSQLMDYFYQELADGKRKDVALQDARNTFLKNANIKQHPIYWGGFVVMGDVSPLTSKNVVLYWMLSLGAVILLFGVYVKRRYFASVTYSR